MYTGYKAVAYEVWQAVSKKQPAPQPNYQSAQQTRITLGEELNAIAQATRKTILFVTHNVEEAVFLGDRCCVLSRRPGRVKALVPVDIPRAQRTWKLFTSDPAFGATKDRVLRLVREEVGGGDER